MKNLLGYRIWLLVVVFVVLAVVLGYYGYWYYVYSKQDSIRVSNQREATESTLLPPAELAEQYDPTQNPAVFQLLTSGAGGKNVSMVYLWPKIHEGEQVKTEISCPDWDYKVQDMFKTVPGVVTRDRKR